MKLARLLSNDELDNDAVETARTRLLKILDSEYNRIKGKAWFKTVSGGTLTAWMDGNTLVLTDEKGGQSRVTIANVYQSNGVIHVVDSVLLPK